MNLLDLPWIELSVAVPVVGAGWVALRSDPRRAFESSVVVTTLAFACTLLAWAAFAWTGRTHSTLGWPLLDIDELSAPLLALVALLHLLTILATARTKMSRVAFGGLLLSEAILLATFACRVPWPLVALLIAGMVPPWADLRARSKPTRVYLIHAGLFVALLVAGQILVDRDALTLAAGLLTLAVLVRCGTVPTHCWITDLFEHASFATALLLVTPLVGVYAAIRLVLPIAPEVVLNALGIASLVTAMYASGMALVQRETRRFYAYLFLSLGAMVMVGMDLHSPLSLTGSLCLWVSVPLSMAGLGLTLRALEARYGRLSLADYHGLYNHSPTLAACFLITGLASVGFPGTLGFIATELLVAGAVADRPILLVGVVLASALNGVAVLRVYFLLFTGTRHGAVVPLGITPREQLVLLTLLGLILGGGLFPAWGVQSRHRAAEAILDAHKDLPGEDQRPLVNHG